MMTRKIKEFRFYFQEQSVIMEYKNQYISFNNFNCRNKLPLIRFTSELQKTRKMDLNKVFGLATQHKINSNLTTHKSVDVLKNIERLSQ
jgi:hypothetical protein